MLELEKNKAGLQLNWPATTGKPHSQRRNTGQEKKKVALTVVIQLFNQDIYRRALFGLSRKHSHFSPLHNLDIGGNLSVFSPSRRVSVTPGIAQKRNLYNNNH